jgi:hypothetical protein
LASPHRSEAVDRVGGEAHRSLPERHAMSGPGRSGDERIVLSHDRSSVAQDDPAFLIAGTPRSGTTLVQRLACELPGVRVPPETHFFSLFARGLTKRRRFPLEGDALREELDSFARLDTSRSFQLEPHALMERLGGRCETVVQLFGVIVRHLARDADVCGEKTTDHLLWWRPLSRALPRLKLVAVVRDPRSVVASNLAVPWGMTSHVVLAERWAADQREVAQARAELGSKRCLILRYEDVVAAPTEARARISALLARPELEASYPATPIAA